MQVEIGSRTPIFLQQFDIDTEPGDTWLECLLLAGDDKLLELARFFFPPASQPSDESPSTSSGPARPMQLFGSHLTEHRVLVGDVSRALALYGIELFVAHDAIEHDKLWQEEIERALDAADAGLVFVHKGLIDSPWCDQEIGWLQGRHVPVMALKFDAPPYGFFAKHQAQSTAGLDAETLAERTVDRIGNFPELAPGLLASLVDAMENSPKFRITDRVWRRLRETDRLDEHLCRQLLDAAKFNSQVYGANAPFDSHQPYPRVVAEYLQRQPGASAIADEIAEYVAYLDEPDFELQQRMRLAFHEERRNRDGANAV